MRIVTYNVHALRDDMSALSEVVRDLAPDVLVLQEAPRRFRWRQRCAALARSFGLVVAVGGGPAMGNLIITDVGVRVGPTWCVRFPLTPGRHLRGAAFADCAFGGTRFVVAGSHLSVDPGERPDQARHLRRVLDGVDAPVLLGADVNDEPGGPAWKALADGLTDPVGSGAAAPTFPARDPRRRIDAIFVDPRIAVTSCRVADTPVARRASDHLPVVADLALPRTG